MSTHGISVSDLAFEQRFAAGEMSPSEFNHRAHLRLAYVHVVMHGPERAVATFREALRAFLRHHDIAPDKFHETLTQAWLQAVWLFMHRCGDVAHSEEFLERCVALHDPHVMLTHYSKDVLFGERARHEFVVPDLEPIPREAESIAPTAARRASGAGSAP